MWRTHHLWRYLNTSSTLIFTNNRITAVKSFNSCTAPFNLASDELWRYRNRLIIIIRHKRIYKLRGSPAWKQTFTLDIQAPWESSMETHIHKRGCTCKSSVGSSINTRYTSSVGVQHRNKHSHWIYKLRGSPARKHTYTQENIHIGGDLVLTLERTGRGYLGPILKSV